jgi:hypothetical protein
MQMLLADMVINTIDSALQYSKEYRGRQAHERLAS